MVILKYAAVAVLSYLLGSFNTAILLTRDILKRDVRKSGSGNAGATNVARVFGLPAGLCTFAGDCLKTVAAMLLGRLILGDNGMLTAAAFCLIGHCWPVYYKFSGGKGVAVGASIALVLDWRVFLVMAAVFFAVFFLTRRVSASSLAGATVFPIALYGFGHTTALSVAVSVFAAALVWYMHRSNVKRLLNGTEAKFTPGRPGGGEKK